MEEFKNKNIKELIENSSFKIDIESCLADKSVEDHILEDRINAVKKYKVKATPTLIINGKKFDKPTDYKKLKNIALIKQSRLSVMPLKKFEWEEIIKISNKN